MKRNLLSARMVQGVLAAAILTVLAGCFPKENFSEPVPVGPDGHIRSFSLHQEAILTDPANSGPHQFPLSVTTSYDFCPLIVQYTAEPKADGSLLIRVPRGVCPPIGNTTSNRAFLPEPSNSGPHQFPLLVVTTDDFYPDPQGPITVEPGPHGSALLISVPGRRTPYFRMRSGDHRKR